MNSTDHVVAAEDCRDGRLLEEVLRSKCFERTHGLRNLLRYLWANRAHEVSEYAIAIDALGRGADFDSKVDATVRVQIGRLRRQLDRYYETEGSSAERRIVIPLGSHRLELINVQPIPERTNGSAGTSLIITAAVLPEYSAPADSGRMPRWQIREILFAAAAILGCVAMIVTVLLLSMNQLNARAASNRSDSPLFWKLFFDNGKPTRIVLPAPLFFAWNTKDSDSLMVRDISINDFDHPQNSPELAKMEKLLGKPARWQGYTVASDTFAAVHLARFLDRYGIQTSFSSSENSPHGITDHENIIAFGTVTSMGMFRSELNRLSFKLGPHERYVIDTLMPPGSPPQFRMIFEPNERAVIPGIVALLPRGSSGNRILLLQGEQTTALIAYLTSDEGMRELGKRMQGMRSPFFEAVILSEVNGSSPLQSRLATFRSFAPQPSGTQRIDSLSSTNLAAQAFPGQPDAGKQLLSLTK